MYNPINYDKIRNINACYTPQHRKYVNTAVYDFWQRSLFQRACSTITFDLPETWRGSVTDFLYFCLMRFGYVAVFNTDEFGTVFNPASITGFDFYYNPTNAIVANPAIKTEDDRTKEMKLKIGEDCELLKLTPDYLGIFDIINIHAEKLALLDCAINMSIANNKFAFFIGSKNKAASVALRKMFDSMQRGELAVFFDQKLADDGQGSTKSEPWQFLERSNLKSSYITDAQLQDFQTILNNFDSELGIPTVPYAKAERMVTSEADSRIIDSTARISVWKDCLDRSIEKVNNMFNLSISCELRYNPEIERGALNAADDVNNIQL